MSVSIVIPCYQQAHYLAEAIESALSQEGAELEVVVVDDGSTDATSDVARAYEGVRCLQQRNRGLSAARNAGLAASDGGFVVFLDADDRLRPGAVASSLALLRARPECAFVYGRHQFVDGDGGPLPTPAQPSDAAAVYRLSLRGESHPIHTAGQVVYRRGAVESVGGYEVGLDGCADLHLNLQIARSAPVCFNDRVVLDHRLHEASMKTRSAYMLRTALAVQRRQRDFVREHQEYEEDYRVGLRVARDYFGRHLAEDITKKVRRAELGSAIRDLGTLVRCDPLGAPRHLAYAGSLVLERRRRRAR